MLRLLGWITLAGGLVLAAGCGGGDSASQTDVTATISSTTSMSNESTPTTAGPATTAGTTTSTAAPESPYQEFLADPASFFETYADLTEPSTDLLGGSPDYRTADTFRTEVASLGIDLTGLEIWVWPVPATGDTLLIFDFDTTATVFEDSDVSEALGTAMATSATLEAVGITRAVITWHGNDDGGPFSVTFSAPFGAIRAAVLDDADLDPEEVLLQVSREG